MSTAVSYRPASVPSGPEIRWSSSWMMSSGGRTRRPDVEEPAGLGLPGQGRELVGGRDDERRRMPVEVLVDDVRPGGPRANSQAPGSSCSASTAPAVSSTLDRPVVPGGQARSAPRAAVELDGVPSSRPPCRRGAARSPSRVLRGCWAFRARPTQRPIEIGSSPSLGVLVPDRPRRQQISSAARSNCWIVSSRSV